METGEVYPIGSWFYVPESKRWYQVTSDWTDVKEHGGYRKEADELTESEANKLGIFRE
jgi:hypothetical protein